LAKAVSYTAAAFTISYTSSCTVGSGNTATTKNDTSSPAALCTTASSQVTAITTFVANASVTELVHHQPHRVLCHPLRYQHLRPQCIPLCCQHRWQLRFQQHPSRHAIGRTTRSAFRSANSTVCHAIGSTLTNYH
jgi:hypothetical protein